MITFITAKILDEAAFGLLCTAALPLFARNFEAFPRCFATFVAFFLPATAEHFAIFPRRSPNPSPCFVISFAKIDVFVLHGKPLPNNNF